MSRSVRINEFDAPEVLKIEDVAIRQPSAGEVRLRIHAIGLNQTEVTFRSGRSSTRPQFPTQMGYEAAGEIEAIGPDVTGFSIGDRVALIPAYAVSDYGLYGGISLAPARSLVRLPDGTSWEDAAATWMPFATARAGLIDIAALSAGQTVVLNAASSSVGLAAIQIALSIGAVPIALTRTSEKVAELKAAGARHVVATTEEDVTSAIKALTDGKGAEVIFDSVAGQLFEKLVAATAQGRKDHRVWGLQPLRDPLAHYANARRQAQCLRLRFALHDEGRRQTLRAARVRCVGPRVWSPQATHCAGLSVRRDRRDSSVPEGWRAYRQSCGEDLMDRFTAPEASIAAHLSLASGRTDHVAAAA